MLVYAKIQKRKQNKNNFKGLITLKLFTEKKYQIMFRS